MPLEHSTDAGNIGGFVHSHRFPAANTAIPVANEDAPQLQLTKDFLKKDIVSVDILRCRRLAGPAVHRDR